MNKGVASLWKETGAAFEMLKEVSKLTKYTNQNAKQMGSPSGHYSATDTNMVPFCTRARPPPHVFWSAGQ